MTTQVLQGAAPGALAVEPVLGYPRVMEPGTDYVLSVDLRPVAGGTAEWPAGAGEEYAVHCIVNGAPVFRSEPLGEPAVVVHRFGGTYGPARFLVTPAGAADQGIIRVTLVNAWGVPLATLETPSIAIREGGVRAAPPARPAEDRPLGAVPLREGGVAFRVWAPNAASVAVTGTFNGWSDERDAMQIESPGYWVALVSNAKAGDEYRFVIHTADGQRLERRDPYSRRFGGSSGGSVVYDTSFEWGDAEYEPPGWSDLVIYELHVGTFGAEPGRSPGSFSGVAARLEYLAELGVNCIQLLPVGEFGTDVGLGYNPSFPFAVESAYGGPDALKKLVREAHARGIAVVLTVVYNHFGPSDLDLWQFDGWSLDDKGGIYFYNDWRARTPWGDTRPDYGRPEVRRYIRDNVVMWLDEFRLDGLHWDAVGWIRSVNGSGHPGDDLPEGREMIQEINAEVEKRLPGRLRSADDAIPQTWATQPLQAGGGGFDTQWDLRFADEVRRTLIVPEDGSRDMKTIVGAILGGAGTSVFARVIYTESHDEVMNGRARVPHDISPSEPESWASRKRSTLGAALVLTAPGIPMLFQAQEILEDGWFHDTDVVDWSRLDRFRWIHALYRDLIRLRRNWFGHTRGLQGQHVQVHHVNQADKVVAFHRWAQGGAGDDVVVVLNFGNRAYDEYLLGFPRPGEWKVRLNSDWAGYSPDYGNHRSDHTRADGPPRDDMPVSAGVSIGAYTAIILSQDPEPAPDLRPAQAADRVLDRPFGDGQPPVDTPDDAVNLWHESLNVSSFLGRNR
ncbi:MAG TPA: alpha-amylase family glycosyl hydrolase [Longimicrobium sp.]|nr:alpha-amylase family glycosyl hydrolase [Longimicrobium sp.]